jgi:hypothetical protein
VGSGGGGVRSGGASSSAGLVVGAQFTCFTSTKVQILTPEELQVL